MVRVTTGVTALAGQSHLLCCPFLLYERLREQLICYSAMLCTCFLQDGADRHVKVLHCKRDESVDSAMSTAQVTAQNSPKPLFLARPLPIPVILGQDNFVLLGIVRVTKTCFTFNHIRMTGTLG